jgi:hypothetical protein
MHVFEEKPDVITSVKRPVFLSDNGMSLHEDEKEEVILAIEDALLDVLATKKTVSFFVNGIRITIDAEAAHNEHLVSMCLEDYTRMRHLEETCPSLCNNQKTLQ